MAGEIAAAVSGLQAPPVPGSTSGDIAGAIAGILKGQQEEEERRRKAALENAMLDLQERQVAATERNAASQERSAGAAELSAKANWEFAENQRKEQERAAQAAMRARERLDRKATDLRQYMYDNQWVPKGSLDSYDTEGIIQVYETRASDRASQRISASQIYAAQIGAFGQAAGSLLANAQANYERTAKTWADVNAMGQQAMANAKTPGMRMVPAKFVDDSLAGKKEGEEIISAYLWQVTPEAREWFFADELAALDELAAFQGAKSYGEQSREAYVAMKAAQETLQGYMDIVNSMQSSSLIAGFDFRQGAGLAAPPGAQRDYIGPVMRVTPEHIETQNGTISTPDFGRMFDPGSEFMTRFKWLAKNEPAAALQGMRGMINRYGAEVEGIPEKYAQALSEIGLDEATLTEMAAAREQAMGLRTRSWSLSAGVTMPIGLPHVPEADESGVALREAKARAEGLIGHARELALDTQTQTSAGVRDQVRARIEHRDIPGVISVAREAHVDLDSLAVIVQGLYPGAQGKNYMNAIRDRWPARIPQPR